MKKLLPLVLLIPFTLSFAQRKVLPTWLHRYVPDISERTVDLTTPACHYKPIFGVGDPEAHALVSVARFGELTVDPNGECKTVSYPRKEQIYVILKGKGILHYDDETTPIRKDDFMYLPPTVPHTIANLSAQPLSLVVMGFKIPKDVQITSPSKLRIANMENEKEQTVSGHPSSVLYKLMLGSRTGTRDTIDSAYVVTSLFWMDFAPGGTNFPHHHTNAEEIYLVVDGHGQMVAGGGMNGVEGLHPAKAGDAYFFRQNCTVGFYNSNAGRAHTSWRFGPSYLCRSKATSS
jgi:mannose-6-phosphate isomerase-like protein (cupin superfamily)